MTNVADDMRMRIAEARLAAAVREQRRGACPCECNSGGFCGGCGHAGCGGRR